MKRSPVKSLSMVISLIGLLLLEINAHAVPLVDTGMPAGLVGGSIVIGTQGTDWPGQMAAIEFTLVNGAVITDVFTVHSRLDPELYVNATLMTEIGPGAGPEDVLKTWEIWGIPGVGPTGGWYPGDISAPFHLSAGQYFLVISAGTDTYSGLRRDAPVDVGGEYWARAVGEDIFSLVLPWSPINWDFGLRIEGRWTPPVPEPTTLLLIGTGLVGLVVFRRKKFRK